MPRTLTFILSLLAILAAPAGTLAQEDAASANITVPAASRFEMAMAADDPDIAARGYFIHDLAPGAQSAGSVRLRNPRDTPVTVALAAVDAETAQTGGSAFADTGATTQAAGAWLRLDAPRVTLAPGEQATVPFTLSLPEGTAPGQYLAGLAAFVPAEPPMAAAPGEHQVTAAIAIQTRQVIAVQVNVPGVWVPDLMIVGVGALDQPSGSRLGLALRNSGDTFITPSGAVTLTDTAGSEIFNQPIALGTMLPGSEITYPVAWPDGLASGEYAVKVDLHYADDQIARYRGTLDIPDDAPVAPAPREAAAPEVSKLAPAPAPPPASAPVATPAPPSTDWKPFLIAGLLGLSALVMIAVLARIRQPRWT